MKSIGLKFIDQDKNMENVKPDLSARYYIAETSVWLLGSILLVARFAGLAPLQCLPLLNVTPEKQQYFPHILAVLLFATTLYVIIEWKQSNKQARRAYWAQARTAGTILWACISLWMSYTLVAKGTRFESISPGWYFAFIVIGLLIGFLSSLVMHVSLTIRTQEESKTLNLPRVPAAVKAQYVTWIPVIFIFLLTYYALWFFSPNAIKGIAPFIVGILCLVIYFDDVITLYFSQDEDGHRIPYGQHIAGLRKAFDFHDYAYFRIEHRKEANKVITEAIKAIPGLIEEIEQTNTQKGHQVEVPAKMLQKIMQAKHAISPSQKPIDFNVEVLEEDEIRFQFYHKDGNPSNMDHNNCGVKVHKQSGKKESLKVLVHAKDPMNGQRGMELPISRVESNAEEYVANHPEEAEITFRKIFSYALNQTAIEVMKDEAGPLLHRAAWTGQEALAKELLHKEETDVNERADFGWTPLLVASAQGYPNILKILLDAGANPNIGNVDGRTPLMFGARYGNAKITRMLLEYHAETDLQDVYGDTALAYAAREGHDKIVDILLEASADTSIKNRESMTALDFAHVSKHGKIAKKLRAAIKALKNTTLGLKPDFSKVKGNDFCPCGSGRKFKKCCENKTIE